MEQLAKHDGGDIAKVVTKSAPKANPPFKISDKHAGDIKLEAEFKTVTRSARCNQQNENQNWLQNREDFVNRNKKIIVKSKTSQRRIQR